MWIFFELKDELMLKDECILVNYMDEATLSCLVEAVEAGQLHHNSSIPTPFQIDRPLTKVTSGVLTSKKKLPNKKTPIDTFTPEWAREDING